MTKKERSELEELSLKAYGSKSRYLKVLRRPATYVEDMFGTVKGRRTSEYPSVEQVKEAMLLIINALENIEAVEGE